MAFEQFLDCITLGSSGDLSSSQYFLTAVSTGGRTSIVATRGAFALGVIQDNTTGTNVSTRVAVAGISKVAAGDTSAMENAIARGTPLMSSSVGRAVPTTLNIGDLIIGHALEPLATGATAIIPVRLCAARPSSS